MPLIYRGWHQSLDAPYRRAEPCWILRVPGRRGIVVGRWRETGYSEEEALHAALGGHGTPELARYVPTRNTTGEGEGFAFTEDLERVIDPVLTRQLCGAIDEAHAGTTTDRGDFTHYAGEDADV